MLRNFVNFVREIYGDKKLIPLHEPRFFGKEKEYLTNTINSSYVSSVGEYTNQFEKSLINFTKSKYAVATINGTSALHIALISVGVRKGDEVLTQSLTFVATCNAIRYCDAEPIFIDVNKKTLGLSAEIMESFLSENCEVRNDGFCWNKNTNKIVRACMPMHTFGFPVELDKIIRLCKKYNISLVEDASEALGSFYRKKHLGTFGKIAAISFNGNKIITTGGGGMLLTNDKKIAFKAKHLTTTAKKKHKWNYDHDEIGYNYRLPNINAALGVAQMELLPKILIAKREIAKIYQDWGNKNDVEFIQEARLTNANYWLNTILTKSISERNRLLEYSNKNGIITRPIWTPMHKLVFNSQCQKTDLTNTNWLNDRLINVPSSAII